MSNVIVEVNPGTLTDNLDAVEASIKEYVEQYSGMVVTEATIKDDKKLLADLRKQKKAIDDQRKDIKKKYLAPFDAFEKKAKKIVDLYDEPINLINGQLKEFEDQRLKDKDNVCRAMFTSYNAPDDVCGWLKYEDVFDAKWLNATTTERVIMKDIESAFAGLHISLSTLKSLNHKFEEIGIDTLKRTHDLQQAIANEAQALEEFIEAQKREAEKPVEEPRTEVLPVVEEITVFEQKIDCEPNEELTDALPFGEAFAAFGDIEENLLTKEEKLFIVEVVEYFTAFHPGVDKGRVDAIYKKLEII